MIRYDALHTLAAEKEKKKSTMGWPMVKTRKRRWKRNLFRRRFGP
jgi:hypothetical protein